MLFGKKKKSTAPQPDVVYTYPQTENYRGFKRYKLSSYGYQPAQDGIRALTGVDLTGSRIAVSIFNDDSPRAVISVDKHVVGTIFDYSFDKFSALKNGKITAIRLEIRDGDSYLFYKV